MDAMRTQLENWGLPAWLVGDVPGEAVAAKERHAQGKGQGRVGLPPAKRASDLFEQVVEDLLVEVRGLSRRTEYLKDGRFVVGEEVLGEYAPAKTPEETPEDAAIYRVFLRDNESPESWRAWCEKNGLDPEKDRHEQWLQPEPRGGSPAPTEPLVSLCALYVLRGGDPEELIERLHPRPEDAPRERFEGEGKRKGIVERLREEARRLATGIRGGEIKTGRKGAAISEADHAVAAYVFRRRRRGVSDERILDELEDGAVEGVPGVSPDELNRLGGLRLDDPDELNRLDDS